MSNGAILVLLQQAQGRLHPVSVEVAAAARDLADQSSKDALGLLLTDEWNIALEQQVENCGLDTVYVCRSARFGSFIAERQSHTLVQSAVTPV
jgi:electron transfer flavoprotein alpha subunit